MNPSIDSNHVTMTGSGNYVCTDAAGVTTVSKGNVNITAYGEDWSTPGAGFDKFWVSNNASGDFTNMLQMPTPVANAVLLTGGNIQVPQPRKK